ncbi:MAG: hypothetical protein H6713_21500 [Myxococcales bacterium]|nr:hypothetical protein [Myxococcales bacterium]MCB9752539.1 hypothetical protein [Myxococcales bacterium]
MRRRAAARIVGGALLTLTACGAPEPDDALTTSPRIVEFSPEHTGARIELVNRGDARVQLSQFRVDPRDPDWGSFTIENESNPRSVGPGERVSLELRVHAKNFLRHGHGGAPDRYHPARASLLFSADGRPRRVALEFSSPEALAWRPGALALRLAALACLLLALLALGPSSPSRPSGADPLDRARGSSRRARRWPLWISAAPFVALLAFAPLGDGLCGALLDASISPADIAQCRDGRAGQPLALLTGPGSLLVVLAAIALAAGSTLGASASAEDRLDRPRARALGLLTLFPALLAPACALASADLHALALAQNGALLDASPLPRWSAWTQPVAFALALLASAAVTGAGPARWLSRAALSVLLASVFLGGWTIPGVAAHGVDAPRVLGLLALACAALAALATWSHRVHARSLRALATGAAAIVALALALSLLTVHTGPGVPLLLSHAAVVALELVALAAKAIAVAWALTWIERAAAGFGTPRSTAARALTWAPALALLNLALTALSWRL